MIDILVSSKQQEQQSNAAVPKYMYQLFGPPSARSRREWKEFILQSGREMEEARKAKDKKKYLMAAQKVVYGWLCRTHLQKFYPWDEFRQKEWWKKLEIPKTD